MEDIVTKRIGQILPGVAVGRRCVTKRDKAVVVRMTPRPGIRAHRTERMMLRFIAPSYDEARKMYLAVRREIVSDGNEPSITNGITRIVVKELGGGAAGYTPSNALYHMSAAFELTYA